MCVYVYVYRYVWVYVESAGVRGWAWVRRNQVDTGHTPVS
jgi:uncharacterized protein YraI